MELFGHSILAYFQRREEAEHAQVALRREGFETVQLDRVSRYPGDGTDRSMNPLTGQMNSLANLTLGADTVGDDSGPLMAADTAASGLAHGLDGDPGVQEQAWLVTVVTEEDRVNRAVQILEDAGGTL